MTTLRRFQWRQLVRTPSPVTRAIAVFAVACFAVAFAASGALHVFRTPAAAPSAAAAPGHAASLAAAAGNRGLTVVPALPAQRGAQAVKRHRHNAPARPRRAAVTPVTAPVPARTPVATPAPVATPTPVPVSTTVPVSTPVPVRAPVVAPAPPAAPPRPVTTHPTVPSYVGKSFDSSG